MRDYCFAGAAFLLFVEIHAHVDERWHEAIVAYAEADIKGVANRSSILSAGVMTR